MEQEYQPKPIDKEYLKSSLKNFDSEVLRKKYLQSDDERLDAPVFTEAPDRTAIESGETLPTLFGKIKKWLSDLKTVAFTGNYDDLTNKPDVSNLSASTTLPMAPGVAAAGTETGFARGDHVHPLQTSVSGNAGTATKLQTARTINGVAFDGSNDITVTTGTTLTAALAAGETTLTFTDAAITDDSIIDIYTTVFGVSPSAMEQNESTLTLTFDAQTETVGVKVRVI